MCFMYIIQWKIERNPLSKNFETFKPLPHGGILNSLLTPCNSYSFHVSPRVAANLVGLPFRRLFRYVSRCRWSRIFLLFHQAWQAEGAQWMGKCWDYACSFFVKMIWPQLSTLSFVINFSKPRTSLWWPNLNAVAHQNLLDCLILTYPMRGHWKRPVVSIQRKTHRLLHQA